MKKNYIIFYTCSIMMTVSMMAQAIDMSKVPNGVSKKSISLYLTAVAPEEMLQFRFAAVNAAFAIADKTRSISLECHKAIDCKPADRAKADLAYQCAWSLIEQQYNQTTDKEVRKLILDRWDDSLNDKTSLIVLTKNQIESLTWGWNHDFMTSTCIKLFNETHEPEIILAFNGILSDYGEETDIPLVKQKIEAIRVIAFNDEKAQAFLIQALQETIETIGRGQVGSPSRIGPARLGN